MLAPLRSMTPFGVLLLLLLLLLAGCGNDMPDRKAGGAKAPAQPDFAHMLSSMGVVKGEAPADADDSAEPMPEPEPDYFEFQPPTETWMTGSRISSTISAGAKKPGEEVGILLRAMDPDAGERLHARTIHYKLTERDEDGQLLGTVAEETVRFDPELGYSSFSRHLPDKEGVRYFLTAEIRNGSVVEDTAFSALDVPVQRVEAELRLDRSVYAPSGEPVVLLRNTGPSSLFFGLDYRLERKAGVDWETVPMGENVGIPSIGYQLAPEQEWEQSIRFNKLPAGEYRFSKTVEGVGTSIGQTLYVEFAIQP